MKYNCDLLVHIYDGMSTIPKKEIVEVESESESDAIAQAKKSVTDKYHRMSHLGLSSITIISVKEKLPH